MSNKISYEGLIIEKIDEIIYYEYHNTLFSLQITEGMCRQLFGDKREYSEHTIEWDEPVEKEYKEFTWPMPGDLTQSQLQLLLETNHVESLKCSESEIRDLYEYNPFKYRKYLGQHN